MKLIRLFQPVLRGKTLQRELKAGRWASGPCVARFERALEAFTGYEHIITCSSGTMAARLLFTALRDRLDIDNSIGVPALTFCSPSLEAIRAGFNIHIEDIDPNTWEAVPYGEQSFVYRMPTDYGGYPLEGEWKMGVAIRDASHYVAGGMAHQGFPYAIFSFHPTKNLASLGGGAIGLKNDMLVEELQRLRDFGRFHNEDRSYDVVDLHGTNGYMTNASAAVALDSLEWLEYNDSIRRKLAWTYDQKLYAEVGRRRLNIRDVHHFYPILLPKWTDRRRFIIDMRMKGIEVGVHYPMLHKLKVFEKHYTQELPVADSMAFRIVSLPCHPQLSLRDILRVSRAVKEVLG